MTFFRALLSLSLFSCGFATLCAPRSQAAAAQDNKSLALLDLSKGLDNRVKASSSQVTIAPSAKPEAPGLMVTVHPGTEAFPGVSIKPALASWNLSSYGHIDAKVVNTGTKPLVLALRVDNGGDYRDNPWDTESISLDPGAADTISVIFGYSYGHHKGFALKPSAIVNLMLFTVKTDALQSFRVESIIASGTSGEKPPIPPEQVRTKPFGGHIFGPGVNFDVATQIEPHGIQALVVGTNLQPVLRVLMPASATEQEAVVKPAIGRWDLRDCLEMKVVVRNMGQTTFTPRAKVSTNGGATDWFSCPLPLKPGDKGTITMPFTAVTPYVVGKPGTGSSLTTDAVSALIIGADSPDMERILYIDSIQADMPGHPDLPDWLGQRPPVAGDWTKTLDDEFDGTTIDSTIWNVYGPNYYDKVSHWSKNDVIVGGGVVKLRYEKKTGHAEDDPTKPETPYAAGYLQTYDKWTQRYGYFEARMKLPKAPGLWPAFWMMPDRGRTAGAGRTDTYNGGMEFDIMENLTRWGPNRYNIAMHYDGYGKDHKALGSEKIYVEPDKDGFITCGLLWTPGSAIFYCNGKEVLRWEDPRISNVASSMLFTLPSGGWDNSELEDSQLPDDFTIDYVRVWQRKDLASAVDGKKAPPG